MVVMTGTTSSLLKICTAITSFCIIPLTISLIWTLAERCWQQHSGQDRYNSMPTVVRSSAKRLWQAKLAVCMAGFTMVWFALATYLLGDQPYACFIMGTIVPMIYVLTVCNI
jgi:hypothetical protein